MSGQIKTDVAREYRRRTETRLPRKIKKLLESEISEFDRTSFSKHYGTETDLDIRVIRIWFEMLKAFEDGFTAGRKYNEQHGMSEDEAMLYVINLLKTERDSKKEEILESLLKKKEK